MTFGLLATVYATFPDEAEAARIGRILVEERLAACVNILGPCRSIYRWEGRIEDGAEVAAIFKTRKWDSPKLMERLIELHPYEVPAVAVWNVDLAGPEFLRWVVAETER